MSRTSPRPVLNLSGAAIHGPEEEKHPSILLPNQQQDVSHFAIDIGGTNGQNVEHRSYDWPVLVQ